MKKCIIWLCFAISLTVVGGNVVSNIKVEEKEKQIASIPTFKTVVVNSRSIHLSWSSPYFALRTLLLYGTDEKDLFTVQISTGTRNHTISDLEPGITYKVVIQIYYSSADMENMTKTFTTTPVFPASDDMKVEMKILLKDSGLLTKIQMSKSLVSKMRKIVGKESNLYPYSFKKLKSGYDVTVYFTVTKKDAKSMFFKIKTVLETLGAEQMGFSFKVYEGCCIPYYFHDFNKQSLWTKEDVIFLNVIPNSSFVSGKCGNAVDLMKGDISVETRGHSSLELLSVSLKLKLNSIKGLQPIASAVNYNTQLRLEVQEGRIVWMFYNIGNNQGFIIQTINTLIVNQWTHIHVDYDSNSGVGRIFLDAVLQEKALSDVVLSSNWILGLRIGNYFSGGVNYKLNGLMDDLQIFSCTMTQELIDNMLEQCGKFVCQQPRRRLEGPEVKIINEKPEDDKLTNKKEQQSLCNMAGTSSESVGKDGKPICTCKENVVGDLCSFCKNGTFGLNKDHDEGCISCFCNGLTKDCRSAKLHMKQIYLNAQDIAALTVLTIDGEVDTRADIVNDWEENRVIYKPLKFADTPAKNFYWKLPHRYCGDKITSYGGNLSFTISFLSQPSDKPSFGADVVLKGNGIELHFTDDNDPLPGQQHQFNIKFYEKCWQNEGKEASREDMISVLSRIDSFLLRASFGTQVIETSLHDIRLEVGSFDGVSSTDNRLHMVEECKCPPQYAGLSCEKCNRGYAKVGNFSWRASLAKCEQCQCNSHASDCNERTGACWNCQHFTTEPHCDKCLPGYYGDPRTGREDSCRPCPCPLTIKSNQFSSTCVLDDDGEAKCDSCKIGHVGKQCERCAPPYAGDPTKPGDYCKIDKESKCSDCNNDGSVESICDKTSGQCICKKNVVGKKCTKCKAGTFFLDAHNKDGCRTCWCSGVSSTCVSSRYFRRLITFGSSVIDFKITDFEELLSIHQGFYINALKELVLANIKKLPNTVLYWQLPKKFTDRKLTAYGGCISYKISYDADRDGRPYSNADIKLVGGGKTLVYEANKLINNRQVKAFKAILTEDYWVSLTGEAISRGDLLNVLTRLDTVLIRATYNTKTKISSVSNLVMTDAVPFDLRNGAASEVERCRCPLGYTGLSCERCSQGYTRFTDSNGIRKCQLCTCNGHSQQCDGETGACNNCLHHTQGDRCQRCQDGFYGNPISGTCMKCACPLTIQTNQFSRTCKIDSNGDYTCNECRPGHTGKKCGKCAVGYTGNPLTPGGTCQKASRRYTAAPTVVVTPERRLDRIKTSAIFTCTVQGEEPLTIIWSRIDGRPLPKRARIESNGNTKTMIIQHLEIGDAETYICSGRNDYGLSTSKAALVVIGYRVKPIHLRVSPKSMRIEQGGIARFYCKDESETTSTVKWTNEGGKLPREATANRGVLTLSNVQRRHSGLYTCFGSNQHSTDRVSVQLHVGVVVTPRASVFPPYETVDVGDNVMFRCSITGYPLPSIAWSRADRENLPKNSEISGPYLKLIDVQSEDEGNYLCTATNRGGTIVRRALLYVRDSQKIPKISNQHLTKVRIRLLGDVNIMCNTGGTSASINWSKKHERLSTRSKVSSDGQLMIRSVMKEDAGVYICTASNHYGKDRREVRVEVVAETGLSPLISLSPKFGTVIEGNPFTILCNVTGDPAPAVMWSRPNEWLTSNHAVTGNALKILKASPQDSGTYVCSGKNKFGLKSLTSVVLVERRVLPKLKVGTKKKYAYAGDKITFTCTVKDGIPKPVLFWKTSLGYRVPENYIKEIDKNTVMLTFKKVYKRLEGHYTCVGLNAAGKVEESVKLNVRGDPKVSIYPQGLYHVTTGDKLHIKCSGFGVPTPALTFEFPQQVTPGDISKKQKNGLLEVNFIAEESFSGKYECKGVNRYGSKKAWVNVVVNKEDAVPTCNVKPSSVVAAAFSRIKLTCMTKGIPNPEIYWTKDNSNKIMSKKHVLIFSSLSAKDKGEYHCHAKNRKGRSHSSTLVDVFEPPVVKISPEKIVARKGHSFILNCKISGSPTPSVEWRKVGTNEIASSLLISDTELVATTASLEEAGTYACIGINTHGTQISYANVSVVEPPVLEAVDETVIRTNMTSDITLKCVATGYPKPHVKWSKPARSTGVAMGGSGELLLRNITKNDQGQYKCQASNFGGFAEETFMVLINELPKVQIKGDTTVSVMAGSQYSLQCIGQGIPLPNLHWMKVRGNFSPTTITSNGGLHFQIVTSSDSGRYRCFGENSYGRVFAEVQINVEGAPVISVGPKKQRVDMKEVAKFFCNVSGSPSPDVSWNKLNSDMPKYHFVKRGYLMIPSVRYEDSGVYVCRAENSEGVVEELMELKVNEFVPKFSNLLNSMIVYETIQNTMYKTHIQISIKASSYNGLLLYNGKIEKDYISLGIIKGHVIFQYDLGSGAAILKSPKKIILNKWLSIEAGREDSTGFLRVENDKKIFGQSLGRFNGLNLKNELYVGGHRNFKVLKKQTQYDSGFTGCISSLIINSKQYDFALSLKTKKVYACDTCAKNNCENGGECIPKAAKLGYTCNCAKGYIGKFCVERVERCYPDACNDGGRCFNKPVNGYFCKCALGKFGRFCEKGELIAIPSFKKHSFISYKIPHVLPNSFKLFLSFKTFSSEDATIFSISEMLNRKKSSLRVEVMKKKVVLKYQLGTDKTVIIRSADNVDVGQWIKVSVEQKGKHASLRVNSRQARKGMARGRQLSLRLNSRSIFFIGGDGENQLSGLHGCIQQLMINEVNVDLVNDFIQAKRFSSCYKAISPCLSYPCRHSSRCVSVASGNFRCECTRQYEGKFCEKKVKSCGNLPDCKNGGQCMKNMKNQKHCLCPLGFIGDSCEKEIKITRSVKLNEESYLIYPRNLIRNVVKNTLSVSVKTKGKNGLLLWYGQPSNVSPDFLLLAIKDGKLEIQIQLGSGEASGRSNKTLNDDKWHNIKLIRTGANVLCKIDGNKEVSFVAPGINKNLDVYSILFLGGASDVSQISRRKYKRAFQGCLRDFRVEGKIVDFSAMPQTGFNVGHC